MQQSIFKSTVPLGYYDKEGLVIASANDISFATFTPPWSSSLNHPLLTLEKCF